MWWLIAKSGSMVCPFYVMHFPLMDGITSTLTFCDAKKVIFYGDSSRRSCDPLDFRELFSTRERWLAFALVGWPKKKKNLKRRYSTESRTDRVPTGKSEEEEIEVLYNTPDRELESCHRSAFHVKVDAEQRTIDKFRNKKLNFVFKIFMI